MTTAFGAITLGSKAAFSDLVGSFVILTTASYALAIGGHLFAGRKHLPRGPFCELFLIPFSDLKSNNILAVDIPKLF